MNYHEQKIIRFPELKNLVALSRSSIFRLEKLGRFPKRRLIGESAVGWVLSEILDWVKSTSVVELCDEVKE